MREIKEDDIMTKTNIPVHRIKTKNITRAQCLPKSHE